MQCPIDGTTLMMSERQGVEIDYCPQCRGVWLDRGELDKLLQRDDDEWRDRDRVRDSDDRDRFRDSDDRDRFRDSDDRDRFRDSDDRDDRYGPSRYPKKKKRWLSEMFEFGDD